MSLPADKISPQPAGLDKPTPRAAKSADKRAQIEVQNRRRAYLERHPSYLNDKEHELADPVLYERLIKRFQTAAERAAEVKAKGYGRTLEADLLRGENRLSELSGSQGAQSEPQTLSQDFAQDWTRPATGKADGRDLWHLYLHHRFVHGRDDEFDYSRVDMNDEYDTLARADAEDAWFDDEEPCLVHDNTETPNSPRRGDTGIQDY